MSRIYAIREDNGERVLLRIECDGRDCSAAIVPHRDIAQSGWVKRGFRVDDVTTESFYCPRCQ